MPAVALPLDALVTVETVGDYVRLAVVLAAVRATFQLRLVGTLIAAVLGSWPLTGAFAASWSPWRR